nr:E3 binding domain-containing protein [Alphaproteobacteria bacterium]
MSVNVLMPALSPTMTEGTLAKWLKKEGDMVKSGDVIAEIETDKATMEVESADEGKLGKILIQAGTSGVAVNTPIAILLEEGEESVAIKSAPPVNTNPEPPLSSPPASAPQKIVPVAEGERVFATPLARRIAQQKGVDLKLVKGSGPHGRIVKQDLETIPEKQTAAKPAPLSSGPNAKSLADAYGMTYKELPNNNIKKVVARRLLESKQSVPHFYLSVDCNLTSLLAARAALNEQG